MFVKKIIAVICPILVIGCFVWALFPFGESEIVTVPYEYPIKPGTTEWEGFLSREEMIEACQIPEEILSRMTTDALVKTILNYPMIFEMLIFETIDSDIDVGFWHIANSFNGLQELMGREDALIVLEEYGDFSSMHDGNGILAQIYRNVKHVQNNKE